MNTPKARYPLLRAPGLVVGAGHGLTAPPGWLDRAWRAWHSGRRVGQLISGPRAKPKPRHGLGYLNPFRMSELSAIYVTAPDICRNSS